MVTKVLNPTGPSCEEYVNRLIMALYGPRVGALSN